MLRLRAGTATLLIGPRAAAGTLGRRHCLDSEAEIRHRLTIALHNQAAREALRRFWGHWQGDARLSGVKDQHIIDRIARLGTHGPLIVFLVADLSLHRRDTAAARGQEADAALRWRIGGPTYKRVQPAAPVSVPMIKTAIVQPEPPVDLKKGGLPRRPIGTWTIARKLARIVVLAADSQKLSLETQQQLKKMLADPAFLAWVVGSLLVWFVSHFFVVGEIFDMLLAGAALVLSGAGIVFAMQALVGAAHLIGEFVKATRNATSERDLQAAADILAEIIAMIGITVVIAALTHATTRATSAGLEAKGLPKQTGSDPVKSTTDPKLGKRRSDESASSSSQSAKQDSPTSKSKTEVQLDKMYEAAPEAKAEVDAIADKIAEEHGGTVAKAPLKSKERALEKAELDYGGDASRVSDIARNTIIVPKDKIGDAANSLRDQGARVKETNAETDEFGYSGVNAKLKTKSGLVAEVQVNSPEMIYAKEKPEIARQILGERQYENIAKTSGVPGGRGHEIYERARNLPLDSPERAALAKESREYYENFR